MRWTARPPRKNKKPADGDERYVRRLLLWPLCLDGEWRWLEFADIQQRFNIWRTIGTGVGWVDAHWN